MKPPISFEPFSLTKLDESGPIVFFFSLSFAVKNENKALKTISNGIDRLVDTVPFLNGETASPAGALEVRPATVAPEEQVPMLQVKRHTGSTLPVRKIGNAAFVVPENVPLEDHFNPLPVFHTPGQPAPVLRFQANVLDDGIILTVAFNHHVFDIPGAGVVLGILAELCRNPENGISQRITTITSSEMLLRKQVSDMISVIDSSYVAPPPLPPVQTSQRTSSPAPAPPPAVCECFVFSVERLEQLRNSCNFILPWLNSHQLPQNSDRESPVSSISSDDVLAALICGSAERARCSNTPSSDCWLSVNSRRFLNPPLPADYMGNASIPMSFQVQPCPVSEQETLSNLSNELQQQLGGLDISSFLPIAKTAYNIRTSLENYRNTYSEGLISLLHPEARQNMGDMRFPPLIVNNLRSLKSSEMYFGPELGNIQTIENAVPWLDGACVVLPLCAAQPEMKNVEPFNVRITLNTDSMVRFKNDQVVQWALQQETANARGV